MKHKWKKAIKDFFVSWFDIKYLHLDILGLAFGMVAACVIRSGLWNLSELTATLFQSYVVMFIFFVYLLFIGAYVMLAEGFFGWVSLFLLGMIYSDSDLIPGGIVLFVLFNLGLWLGLSLTGYLKKKGGKKVGSA